MYYSSPLATVFLLIVDIYFSQNGKSVPLPSSSEGLSVFRQGWARRSDKYTDFGPAKNYTSVLIYLDLVLVSVT